MNGEGSTDIHTSAFVKQPVGRCYTTQGAPVGSCYITQRAQPGTACRPRGAERSGGGGLRREGRHIYIYVVVHNKPTQHCQMIFLQQKNLKNINEPNSTIKKHRIIGWIIILFLKKDLPYAASKRLDLDLKSQAENEGTEIDIPCKCNEKKAGITILL